MLQVFEDKPRAFDAWELEPTIDLKREEVTDLSEVSVREHALGWEVDFVWNLSQQLHPSDHVPVPGEKADRL